MEYTISSHGDAGDLVAILPIARALGKASILVSDSPICKPVVSRIHLLKDLFEQQEYIERCDPWRGEEITHNVAPWRDGGIEFGANLCKLHANYAGVRVSEEPWLKVDPNKDFEGCVVINRSTRHHNKLHNWEPILRHYGDYLVFLGLREEHIQLQNETGLRFRHHPTKNLLECAQIIQASRCFLGNQSSNLNLAIGLGKKFLCETSLSSLDCIYNRPGSYYCLDGGVEEFEVEGFPNLNLPSPIPEIEVDFKVSPPGSYWFFQTIDGQLFKNLNARSIMRDVNAHESANGIPLSTNRDLAHQMHVRHPNWLRGCSLSTIGHQVQRARDIIRKKQANRPSIEDLS